jgi:uncharacterized membrane protein
MKYLFSSAISLTCFAIATTANIALSQTQNFTVGGNEPFWSIAVSPRGIVYSTPESKKVSFAYTKPLKAKGQTADSLRVYILPGGNTLTIKKGDCSDGMSDIVHPYSAVFLYNRQVLAGCARTN